MIIAGQMPLPIIRSVIGLLGCVWFLRLFWMQQSDPGQQCVDLQTLRRLTHR